MRRLGYIAVALLLLGAVVRADEGLQDNQDGNNFAYYDAGSFSGNNLITPLTQYTSALPTGEIVIGPQPAANWTPPVSGATPNVRWYCLDGVSGNDANVGYSDTSAADCGTKAVRTALQMNAIIPPGGSGRNVVALVASTTYSDWLSFASGRYGYNGFLVRATVTDSTSGSVAFSDSAIDRITAGGVTATGMNAAGYNPTGSPTTRAIQCLKVGGGAPGFPAEVPISLPGGARLRFSTTTATVALRNFVTTVVKVSGGDTLEVASLLPAVPSSSDVFYLEMPGAIFTHVNALGAVSDVGTSFELVGIQTTGTTTGARGFYLGGGAQAAFCWNTGTGQMEFSRDLFSSFNSAYQANGTTFDTGGACRATGNMAVTGGTIFGVSIGISPYAGSMSLVRNGDIELPNSFVSVGGLAIDLVTNQAVNEGDGDFIGTNAPTFPNGRAGRILGPSISYGAGLFLGSSVGLAGIEFSGMGANPAIKIAIQGGQFYFRGPLSNGTAGGNTDVGLDLTTSAGSLIVLPAIPTVTGTAGDVRLCDGTIITWSQAAAGIVDVCGNRLSTPGSEPITVLPAGTTITSLAGSGTSCVQTSSTGQVTRTGAACGSGSGTVVGPLSHDVTTPSSSSGVASVVGLTETSGPTDLVIGSISNGQCLVRSGSTVVGASCGGASFYQTWTDGTFTPLPQEPLSTAGSGLSIADDPSDGATVVSLPATGSAGSCTNCSLTFDLFGRETARASGTAPVTSVGVTAPITSTGGTTPTIGISLPAGQVGYGTGTNVTSSPKFIVDDATFAPATHVEVSGRIQAGIGSTGGDLLGVAGSTFTGGFQIWKDLTPSKAMNLGLAVPGGAIGNNLVISGYTGSAWGEVCEFENVGGMACKNVVAPGTPASGFGAIYIDSTSKNLAVINDAGTVNHGAQTHTAASGKAFTALADTGAWTETSFQAPIAGNTCGSNTFATSISTAGALTCTQPAFMNLSGSLACSQLPAFGGDLASSGGTCSVQVQAIEETSGPSRLAIGAIADLGAGKNNILVRPGGTGTVVGVSPAVLLTGAGVLSNTLSYYAVGIAPAIASGRLATSMTTVAAGVVEYPIGVAATSWTLAANVLTNTLSAGTTTFYMSHNGTIVAGPAYAAGATGVVSAGPTTITSTAASDTWGVYVSGTGVPTGNMTATVTLTVNY